MIYLLQVYRGIAAILVLFHHSTLLVSDYFGFKTPFLSVFYGGNSGVQFFFVLSGFIIYFIHKSDIGQPAKLNLYLKKRFIRIYPIYFFVSMLVIPLYFILPSFGEDYYRTIQSVFVSLLLIPSVESPHVDVAWTLTHELFFYLIFAVLIVQKRIGWIFVYLLCFSIVIRLLFFPNVSYPLTFILSPNNLLFFLGIFAAYLLDKQRYDVDNNHVAIPLFVLGNVVMLAAILLYGYFSFHLEQKVSATLMIGIFGLSSFLIILQSGNNRLESFFKKRKILLLIGNASYSLYLLHYLVITFLVKVFFYLKAQDYMSIYLIYGLLIISGIVTGIILHKFVEKPLLSKFKRSLLK